jgi:hypothetical protein
MFYSGGLSLAGCTCLLHDLARDVEVIVKICGSKEVSCFARISTTVF